MRWLLLMFALCAMPAMAEVRDPAAHFFQPKLGDFKAELDAAKQEGKVGILLMFELDDCPWCHRMKATILNQSEVQDWYRKHFLIYTIDAKGDTAMTDFTGKETTEKAFALDRRVRATPVFQFYDLTGKPTARYTGATQNKEEFLLLGRYVVEGGYKTMPFNVYKRQAGQ
ncbi:MAG: thioredoxin fold domain-containing protein [Hydrogenophilaceae bacterium]|nr:thioredoxin fold domain-containing protein [Hydrogenophilaceae bacterium]